MNRKFLILICLILFFVSVAAVSAAEDVNQTVDESSGDIISISQDGSIRGEDYNKENMGVSQATFLDLEKEISGSGENINLSKDYYKYSNAGSTILINSSKTIDGNGAVIDMKSGNLRVFEINGKDISVTFKNMTFKNVNYIDSYGSGSAIIVKEGDVRIEHCTFKDNHADGQGAAIYSEYKNIYVTDCEFINNTADGGGAISSSSMGSDSIIQNCYFVNNSAYGMGGGAISFGKGIISNCTFVNCTSMGTSSESGGAIRLETSNSLVANCTFVNNFAKTDGGAIYAYYPNQVEGCIFINNTAEMDGGAIEFRSGGSIINSIFKNNTGYGVIHCCPYEKGWYHALSIVNSTFINNYGDYGGVINVRNQNFFGSDSNYVIIDDSIFEKNAKYNFDGIVRLDENDLTINLLKSGKVTVEVGSYENGTYETYKSYESSVPTGFLTLNLIDIFSVGDYDARIIFHVENEGDYEKWGEMIIPVSIKSPIVLDVPDVTKDYGGSERLEVTLTDDGFPIEDANININLNGVDYPKTTDSEGQASMAINLPAGTYPATVTYEDISTTAKVTVNQLATKTSLSSSKNSHNSVTLTAAVNPSTATGNVVFNVNGKEYTDKVSDSKSTYTLNNLAIGSYEAKATYGGDANHEASTSNSVKFTVEEIKIDVNAPDLTKYYKGPERFVVTVKENNVPLVGKNVTINLNGKPYTRTTDEKGEASMAINLNSGVYNVTSQYEDISVDSKITVKSTVSGSDVTKIFRNGTQYYAAFVDTKGNLMKNTDVKFNINGVFYTRTTNGEGVARMNINLPPGTYIITAENPDSTEKYTNVINVLPSIVENHDLTKYYRNESKYTLRIIGDNGKPVGEGVTVRLNINGVFYERKTDASGYMAMNINLPPGTYTVTAEYNGLMASNTIKVLSTLETRDLSMKYRDGSRFEAKVLDGQGKPYAGQTVTFNINGVFYQRTAGDDGIARLSINLMAGEYIITSMFNGLNAANRVTISG